MATFGPVEHEMRHEACDQHEVDVARARDLIGDVEGVAAGVADRGSGVERQRRPPRRTRHLGPHRPEVVASSIAGHLLGRRHEPVSPAVHRANAALRLAVVAEGPSSRLDAARQRGLRHEAITPHLVEQLLLGHDPVAVTQQMHEHGEHLRLDLDRLAPPAQLNRVGVELAVLEHIPHQQRVWH